MAHAILRVCCSARRLHRAAVSPPAAVLARGDTVFSAPVSIGAATKRGAVDDMRDVKSVKGVEACRRFAPVCVPPTQHAGVLCAPFSHPADESRAQRSKNQKHSLLVLITTNGQSHVANDAARKFLTKHTNTRDFVRCPTLAAQMRPMARPTRGGNETKL